MPTTTGDFAARTKLPNGLLVIVRPISANAAPGEIAHVHVEYRGTAQAMFDAGAITFAMRAAIAVNQKGRPRVDDAGDSYRIARDRKRSTLTVTRIIRDLDRAQSMPGVAPIWRKALSRMYAQEAHREVRRAIVDRLRGALR